MKHVKQQLLAFFMLLVGITGCGGPQHATTQSETNQTVSFSADALLSYQNAITPQYLKSQLSILAADSMRGRETGMPGQKKAARFLASQYRKLGLAPVGDDGSYFQKFDLTASQTDSVVYMTYANQEDGSQKNISESVGSKTTSANYIRQFGSDDIVRGDIVFAGYGIQDEALGINQFAGADLKGKWVMIFSSVPQVINGDTLYTNSRQYARSRIGNILQQGVAGILIIPDMSQQEFDSTAAIDREEFGEPAGMQLKYLDRKQSSPDWSYDLISPAHATKLLQSSDLDSLKNKIAQNIKIFKVKDTGFGLTQIPYVRDVPLESENVVAFLKGADPQLSNQIVILSAHYDHLGIGMPDSTGDRIYNGANDDGSGTIGVLSAARAFAKAKENGIEPRRSILFLSVAGEEKGLLGSRYYSDHPLYPINQTVADINTDMIGRMDPEHRQENDSTYIYVIGGKIISSDLDSLMRAGNAQAGNLELDPRYNDLNDPNQFYRRSDHWNFGRFGIPFVFFFNGVHEDYHQPSDEVSKIDFSLMAKTARTMYATTVMVANADSVPQVDNQEFINITKQLPR